jgi:crossover junction endodeoxyribonuclease RuvC
MGKLKRRALGGSGLFLGIDPGMGGALGLIEQGRVLRVLDMPVLRAEGKKGRAIVNIPVLIDLLTMLRGEFPHTIAALENVRSMPRDGHVGAFSFGRCFGTIETALYATGYPVLLYSPHVWKKGMGLTSDKDRARALASRLFPKDAASSWPLKKHDGRAEAVLLAYWAANNN